MLVVEGSQTSGALITARWALEQGRDVFAVPGGIDAPLSQGPNGLIRRGEAKLIQDAWDVVGGICGPSTRINLHPKTPLAPGAARARLEGRESPPPAPPQQKEPAPARLVVDLGKDPEALTDDQAALLRALQARGNSPPTTWRRPRAFPPGGCSPPSPCSRSASGWRRQGGGSPPWWS
ncbi:MAG: DNA-processing protein DprA [Evtepia gabavorous]